MSKARQQHLGKGPRDRERYVQGTVRRQVAEATDPSDLSEIAEFDDTESTESPSTKLSVAPNRIPPRQSAVSAFIKHHFVEAILILFLAWVASQIYSMNREVGNHSVKLDDAKTATDRLERRVDELDRRTREDLLRLQDQLERRTAPVIKR